MADTDLREQGRTAARRLWDHGVGAADFVDPLSAEFADAAVYELERLQKRRTQGVIREALVGAEMSAEQLDVAPFQGLLEVVQNADDLLASEVRIGFRFTGGRNRLLVVHNGDRVRLDHVLAMTLAFVSTKRQDAKAKGRFGIGLKTLGKLSDRLTVHCNPYHFTVAGGYFDRARAARSIARFYDARGTDTLLELELKPDVDADELEAWVRTLGAEAMLFLDSVRSIRLVDLSSGRARVHHRLRMSAAETVALVGIAEACIRRTPGRGIHPAGRPPL